MLKYEEIVVCFWAVGPAYVKSLKKTIHDYLTNNPSDVFPFTVLTDRPEEFVYLYEKSSRCLKILDLNEERKNFSWSFEYEIIPEGKTEEEYSINYRNILHTENHKKFSYALHRFSIPYLIKNNYTKFIILDVDVHIRMGNVHIQDIVDTHLARPIPEKDNVNSFKNYLLGGGSWIADEIENNFYRNYYYQVKEFFKVLIERLNISKEIPNNFITTDGPVRFYNLDSTHTVEKFFYLWNEAVKLYFENSNLLLGTGGGIMHSDEWLLSAVYKLLDLDVDYINGGIFNILHRVEDRYFAPSGPGYKPTDTREDFIKVNRQLLIDNYKYLGRIDNEEDLDKYLNIEI